ncbi:MAG: DNA-binding transcriptional regulator, partial [Planctomycetes bacterium]|nr:DNA-binding transcriptional regulator [Planctomycetota bacterium]
MIRPRKPLNVPRVPNVALLVEVSSAHARGLIRGISRYAQSHGPWKLHLLERLRPADIRRSLDAWGCDSLIARVKTQAIAEALSERGVPVVNVSGTTTIGRWQRVDTDDAAVCWLAAGHLLDRGYHSFGFCGMPHYEWSRRRGALFAAELTGQGLDCQSMELPSLTLETTLRQKDRLKLVQWITNAPKPLGIMACSDYCGRVALEACGEAGVVVPDEVGVIGVDNDDLVCELCTPPLSSIEANCDRIGYVAAETLAQLLRGSTPEGWEALIKPTKLVSRRSTDATAVGEPVVAEALRFIRAYACSDMGVLDVARHVNVSRRYLEQQFRNALGRSIFSEIQRVRLETAQRLLGETDWKLETVAG